MIIATLNETIKDYLISSSSTPIINPFMVYLTIGGLVLMIVCCGYLVIKKPFRKKSKTKPKIDETKEQP